MIRKLICTVGLMVTMVTHSSYGLVDEKTLLSWTDSYEEAYPGVKIPYVDAKNTHVLSFEKIVRSIISKDGSDWVDYLLQLAQTKDEKAWEGFCSDLVYGSNDDHRLLRKYPAFYVPPNQLNEENNTVIEIPPEHRTAYVAYVYKKLVGAFNTLTHRQMVILFYCALRCCAQKEGYDTSIYLGFVKKDSTGQYDWQTGTPTFLAGLDGDTLVFPDTADSSTKDGFTLPYLLGQTGNYAGLTFLPAEKMDEAFCGNDTFFHELGHLIAHLMDLEPRKEEKSTWFQTLTDGFNYLFRRMPKFDFEPLLQHPLFKNLFYPGYSPENVAKIQKNLKPILSNILSTPNAEQHLREMDLLSPNSSFGRQFWPSYEKACRGVPRDGNFVSTVTENLAKDKNFLYFFNLFCVYNYYHFAPWEDESEILQLAGLAYYHEARQPLLLVNPWCDINLWIAWEQFKKFDTYFFVWTHWGDASSRKKHPTFVNWCPEPQYVSALLQLLKIDTKLFPSLEGACGH